MALDTRRKAPAPSRPAAPAALWRSTIGKKVIMALTGLIMVGYLAAHMVGNLKIFSGEKKFNDYSHWLRTFAEPVLPYEGFLWLMRILLLVAVVAHIVTAVQLTRRGAARRPKVYGGRRRGDYVTFTMRSGGIVLFLFIVWHILDFTTLTVNPRAEAGNPYQNLLATFDTWYGNVIYITALLALGYHLHHGVWSAAQTLGIATTAGRNRAIKAAGSLVGIVIAGGFVVVPLAVMTGVVS
jgi:succinate dehydrogenase / fumarate reductase, cytochrome b subunit